MEPTRNPVDYIDAFDVRASVRSIGAAIRSYPGVILGTTALCLGLITLYIFLWPPVFRANGLMRAEKDVDSARDSFYTNWSIFRKEDAQTEIELMRAGPILEEVIRREKLTYDDVYHPFFSHASYLWQKTPVAKAWRDFKSSLFPEKDPLAPKGEGPDNAKTIQDMYSGITVEPVGETNVGKLTVRGPSRRVAQIANTLMDVYMEYRMERHGEEAQRSVDILSKEVALAKGEVNDISSRRLKLALDSNVSIDLHKESIEVGKLAEMEIELANTRARIASQQATLDEIDKQVAQEKPVMTTGWVSDVNPLRETLKQRRADLEGALSTLLTRYREDSPEVRDVRADLSKVNAMIAETSERVERSRTESVNDLRQGLLSKRQLLMAELKGSLAGEAVMQDNVERLQKKYAAMPAYQTQMRALERDYALAQEKYNTLMAKLAQAQVSLASNRALPPTIRIVEYATIPGDKSWPSYKILYPSALLVGLLLGVGAAVLRANLSGAVKREYLERDGNGGIYGHVQVGSKRRVVSLARGGRTQETRSASGPA